MAEKNSRHACHRCRIAFTTDAAGTPSFSSGNTTILQRMAIMTQYKNSQATPTYLAQQHVREYCPRTYRLDTTAITGYNSRWRDDL